jgi:hypothetical protein
MFSINIYLRFALIGISLVGGVILAIFTNFWYALPVILIGIVLLVGYFLFGTIQSAAVIMQTGDMDAAEARLSLTKKPDWLFGPNKAMFYMIKGTMALNRKDLQAGEEWFKKAEGIKMPSDNETAMVQVQLAALNASRRKWNQANLHLKTAKKLKITNAEIKGQLTQIEAMVKTKGQSHAVKMRQKGTRGQRFHN